MSLSHTYHSLIGVVNIVFTCAMLALSYAFWNRVPDWVQLVFILAVLWFPVIQPLFIYFKCKSQVAAIPAGLMLDMDHSGVLVTLGDKQEKIVWGRVKGLILERNMVILRVDDKNGYFLTNRVLGGQRDELIEFVKSHIE